jgi:hypothetical protein
MGLYSHRLNFWPYDGVAFPLWLLLLWCHTILCVKVVAVVDVIRFYASKLTLLLLMSYDFMRQSCCCCWCHTILCVRVPILSHMVVGEHRIMPPDVDNATELKILSLQLSASLKAARLTQTLRPYAYDAKAATRSKRPSLARTSVRPERDRLATHHARTLCFVFPVAIFFRGNFFFRGGKKIVSSWKFSSVSKP